MFACPAAPDKSLRNLSPKLSHPHEERIRMSSELVSQPELDWNDKAYLGLVSFIKDSPGKVMIHIRSWRLLSDSERMWKRPTQRSIP